MEGISRKISLRLPVLLLEKALHHYHEPSPHCFSRCNHFTPSSHQDRNCVQSQMASISGTLMHHLNNVLQNGSPPGIRQAALFLIQYSGMYFLSWNAREPRTRCNCTALMPLWDIKGLGMLRKLVLLASSCLLDLQFNTSAFGPSVTHSYVNRD